MLLEPEDAVCTPVLTGAEAGLLTFGVCGRFTGAGAEVRLTAAAEDDVLPGDADEAVRVTPAEAAFLLAACAANRFF